MITSVKQAEAIAKEYNKLKTDLDRLQFIKEQGDNLKVILDNDCTSVEFHVIAVEDEVQEEAIGNINLNSFDEYHGWGEGNVELFKFAGIFAEPC